jgi:hypothetical protein
LSLGVRECMAKNSPFFSDDFEAEISRGRLRISLHKSNTGGQALVRVRSDRANLNETILSS